MSVGVELRADVGHDRFMLELLIVIVRGLTLALREGRDNDVARETFERTGASVTGASVMDVARRLHGEAPFHTPVFVVTWTYAVRER